MPPIPRNSKRDPERERIREQLAAYEEFADPAKWEPSNNRENSLWRDLDGARLTIYRQKNGLWGWCIARSKTDQQFSPFWEGADDPDGAALNLARALGVCE